MPMLLLYAAMPTLRRVAGDIFRHYLLRLMLAAFMPYAATTYGAAAIFDARRH